MKARNPSTGEFQNIRVRAYDNLPIGTEVDFEGDTIPIGWEEVDDPNTYSEEEQRIGTWIDGKPLYRKVIDFGTLPNGGTKHIDHNISNLKDVTRLDGLARSTTFGTRIHPNFPAYNQNIQVTNDTIQISNSSDASSYTLSIILEYTKTTD